MCFANSCTTFPSLVFLLLQCLSSARLPASFSAILLLPKTYLSLKMIPTSHPSVLPARHYISRWNLLFLVLSSASDATEMTPSCVSCPGEPTTHFWLPMRIKAFPELSTLMSAVPLPGGCRASHFTFPGHAQKDPEQAGSNPFHF